MYVDLSEIVTRRGMRVSLPLDMPGPDDPDLVFTAPLQGALVFSNSGELLNIRGSVDTAVQLPCARCLADTRLALHLDVEEHLPIAEVLSPRSVAEEGDLETPVSSVVHLDQGRPILDLTELLRQLSVASLPLRVLCRQECPGLCVRCGHNLGAGPCACPPEEQHRPLAGLAALMESGATKSPRGNGEGSPELSRS
jgi:uncharacterized protein